MLDTYTTFGCKDGEPTFRYSLLDGVKEGFLINPTVVDARTDITADLLSEKGYAVMVEKEEGGEEEESFFQRDFEKKFFSEKTNTVFCQTFLENALKDPISGEIGKSIIFCVSQKHASKITQMLNKMASQLWPEKYNSDFAVQITSNVQDSQQFTINFANNNLNGHTKFLDNYKSSKTRVCVTVGMMTTGYDCSDVLNLALMRPVFSPTDFIQIKGRGTRKHAFEYTDEYGDKHKHEKVSFKFFDFFANCEYFEEKFDYDEILIVRDKYEDKPNLFLNLDKIRKSENCDRRISWREVLERIFGFINKFKDKNELLEEECEKFISIYKPESKYVPYIKNFMKAYVTDEYFRNEINDKRFPRTYAGFRFEEYKALNGWRETVPEYVKDYVPVNQFMR
jgi:type I site-specific restriction endonuclease